MKESIQIIWKGDEEEIGRITLHLYDHEIVDVIVKGVHRKQGYGKKLVRAAEALALEFDLPRVFATTLMSNAASNELWRKSGYGDPYFKFEKRLK